MTPTTYTSALSVFIGLYSAPACGEWVRVRIDMDPAELHEVGERVAAKYGCEEYGIFDVDGVSASIIGEGGYAVACNLAAALDEVPGGEEGAFTAWVENTTPDVANTSGADLVEAFREEYQGAFDEVSDWAEQYVDEVHSDALAALGDLACYFNFASFARDAELGGDIWTARAGGCVHVFNNN